MAKVDDATSAVGSDANWFKVNEMGLPSDNPMYWATEVLNVSFSARISWCEPPFSRVK